MTFRKVGHPVRIQLRAELRHRPRDGDGELDARVECGGDGGCPSASRQTNLNIRECGIECLTCICVCNIRLGWSLLCACKVRFEFICAHLTLGLNLLCACKVRFEFTCARLR